MKKLRGQLGLESFGGASRRFIAVIVVMLAVPIGVAAGAISSSEPDHRFAVASDAARSSNPAVTATAADEKSRTWGTRVFVNQRGERCADAGILMDGIPSVATPGGWKKLEAGQDGICGTRDEATPVVGSKLLPPESGGVSLAYGFAPETVSYVEARIGNETVIAKPSPATGSFLAVLNQSPLKTAVKDSDENQQVESVFADAEKNVQLTLVFSDGSKLGLSDLAVDNRAARLSQSDQSQAAAARAQLLR